MLGSLSPASSSTSIPAGARPRGMACGYHKPDNYSYNDPK
jgi:hypothetical protein